MGLTTDPTDECIKLIRSDGMQECYLILPESERAKGFVRPVRESYRHLACGAVTTMALPLAETYARDPNFYGGTFCVHCGAHFDLTTPRYARQILQHTADVKIIWNFVWDPPDGSYVGE